MRKLAGAIVALILAVTVEAENRLDGLLAGASRSEAASAAGLVRTLGEGEIPGLAPTAAFRDRLAAEVRALRPTVGAEVLRLLGSPRSLDTQEGRLLLLNSLAAASAMRGMTYWSVSRGKEWVLFTQSYAVESPDHPVRIADPRYVDLPAEGSFFTFVEDTSFGKNIYRTSLRASVEGLWMRTENVTQVSFLFVPLIAPGSFVSYALLIPDGKEVLFYGAAFLRTSFPIGDHSSRAQSLKNRITALSRWLAARLLS